MNCRQLDLASYSRRAHFSYFSSLAYPYVGMTVNVDITTMLHAAREKKLPLFLTLCYCVCEAANSVPEFRQRIVDGGIVEFDRCRSSHTVALEDGTYCYCTLENGFPLPEFLRRATAAQEEARRAQSIEEDEGDMLDLFFLSTLPWVSYSALVQPVPIPADSNPRITWGKYFDQNGRTLLPLSVLCHHALVDGIHIARFYEAMDAQLAAVSRL